MIRESVHCPACGATSLKKNEEIRTEQLTFGPQFQFKEVMYECSSCGESGDFTGETDKNLEVAERHAQESALRNYIEGLSEMHITMAYIERVFELPARTLTRWKSGDFSRTSLALLRVIAACPWMTEIAENRFDPDFANQVVIREAYKTFGAFVEAKLGSAVAVDVKHGDNSTVVTFSTQGMKSVRSDSEQPIFSVGESGSVNTCLAVTGS